MVETTSKWLIITEKPSVAADIAKALGGFEKKGEYYESAKYDITWAVGHLLEFLEPEEIDPKYKRWLLQDLPILPTEFQYKPKKTQTDRLKHILALAKKQNVAGFINACDAGREGELIFREIYDYCKQKKAFKRLWLQSMTADSIRRGFSAIKPGEEYNNLADAARCRAESDWLIGINGTRAVTKRLKTRSTKGVWSVGRVQTPTLALIVKRELEHLSHRPEPYFTLTGHFSTPSHSYLGMWFDPKFKKSAASEDESVSEKEKEDRIFSKAKLDEILSDFNKNKGHATAQETRKESKEIAPQLFDLTLLQREANRKFGISASRTLQAAQRLYEKHKLLTYPRTDSRYLPEDYRTNVDDVLKEFYGAKTEYSKVCQKILKAGLLNQERIFNNKYISDHFAIIPTGQLPSSKLDGDDARIFDLVFKRFLAAFMPHAVWAKVERITQVGAQNFRTRVQDLQVPGWREVYGLDTEEESKLPRLNEKELEAKTPVQVTDVKPEENATKPPPRFTEARLLSLMEHCGRAVSDEDLAQALEEKGLGTPATRADIIENLILKEYVVRSAKALKATSKGIRLVDILSRIPIDALSKVELTGEMEFDLRLIEKGQKKRVEFMKNMYKFATSIVEKASEFEYETLYKKEEVLGKCPVCKTGQISEGFWGYQCSNQSKKENPCKFIIWKEKNLRYIDPSLVKDVLSHKVVGPFEFTHPSGTTYEEYLTVSETKGIVFCNEDGKVKESTSATSTVLHEEYLEKTFLNMPGLIKETENAYFCEFGKKTDEEEAQPQKETKKGRKKETEKKTPAKKKVAKQITSRMPKLLCGRPVSLEEYKSFIETGATPPIMDFKSKKGRNFAASLHLKENGNFEFKFVARPKPEKSAQSNSASKRGRTKKKTAQEDKE